MGPCRNTTHRGAAGVDDGRGGGYESPSVDHESRRCSERGCGFRRRGHGRFAVPVGAGGGDRARSLRDGAHQLVVRHAQPDRVLRLTQVQRGSSSAREHQGERPRPEPCRHPAHAVHRFGQIEGLIGRRAQHGEGHVGASPLRQANTRSTASHDIGSTTSPYTVSVGRTTTPPRSSTATTSSTTPRRQVVFPDPRAPTLLTPTPAACGSQGPRAEPHDHRPRQSRHPPRGLWSSGSRAEPHDHRPRG